MYKGWALGERIRGHRGMDVSATTLQRRSEPWGCEKLFERRPAVDRVDDCVAAPSYSADAVKSIGDGCRIARPGPPFMAVAHPDVGSSYG